MDVSPNQLVSVAASLIPFLENDDANRALMGSNMQRQAVPLLRTDAPLVGTGMERVVARDSGVTVVAKRDGVVETRRRHPHRGQGRQADDRRPRRRRRHLQPDQVPALEPEHLHQPAADREGRRPGEGGRRDRRRPGDRQGRARARPQHRSSPSCRGAATTSRTRSSSRERIVKDDFFTSIHIEEFECVARDTKLGKEEITRDIPNVGEEALKDLDESGIVRIGAEVKPGDILVGKITPKGETQLSPGGEAAAGDLRREGRRRARHLAARPAGRRGHRDRRAGLLAPRRRQGRARRLIEEDEIARLRKDQEDEIRIIRGVDAQEA